MLERPHRDPFEDPAALPRWLAALPPISGRARSQPEDFRVDEWPAYDASGEGEHILMTIEKRDLSTLELVRRISQATKVRERDIGVAGLKDGTAITTQRVSLPRGAEVAAIAAIDPERIRVLDAHPHKNKLKTGHLKGNRFTLVIRGGAPGDEERARAILERLAAEGLPNGFGPQRFGQRQNSHLIGRALLRRDPRAALDALLGRPRESDLPRLRDAAQAYEDGRLREARELLRRADQGEAAALDALLKDPDDAAAAVRAIPARIRRLMLSAAQSACFNSVLRGRMTHGFSPQAGDILSLHRNLASFLCEQPEVDGPRYVAGELAPSGPLFGPKLLRPSPGSLAAELEAQSLTDAGLSERDFEHRELRGSRRPLVTTLQEAQVRSLGEGALELRFALPRGCFATAVLHELGLSSQS